jgi:hypothetical protein
MTTVIIYIAWSGNVGFVVNLAALGQFFSNYFGFPSQSFDPLLHTHHHLSFGARTKKGQIVANVPSELSLTPPPTS